MAAAVLCRLGRMALNEACALSYGEALTWIEDFVEVEKLLKGNGSGEEE